MAKDKPRTYCHLRTFLSRALLSTRQRQLLNRHQEMAMAMTYECLWQRPGVVMGKVLCGWMNRTCLFDSFWKEHMLRKVQKNSLRTWTHTYTCVYFSGSRIQAIQPDTHSLNDGFDRVARALFLCKPWTAKTVPLLDPMVPGCVWLVLESLHSSHELV